MLFSLATGYPSAGPTGDAEFTAAVSAQLSPGMMLRGPFALHPSILISVRHSCLWLCTNHAFLWEALSQQGCGARRHRRCMKTAARNKSAEMRCML